MMQASLADFILEGIQGSGTLMSINDSIAIDFLEKC
jgi:hypothetical protein